MAPTKVVVTGAAGFIGSHLTEACLARGWDVTTIDSMTTYYSPAAKVTNALAFSSHPRCKHLEQDLLDVDLPALIEGAEHIFHLAAQAGVRASWGQTFDVYTQLNVTVFQRLLEAAREASALKSFIFASSSSVYGESESMPTTEDQILRPLSPYGATKALGEHLAYLYYRTYGVPTISLRYFSVYGSRQRPDMAFHRAIEAAIDGQDFYLNGDGTQSRDFTHVHDIVEGTLLAATYGKAGRVYNLGGGGNEAMTRVLELVKELAGNFCVRTRPPQQGDVHDTSASIDRARRELGYNPAWDLRKGLVEQIDWHVNRERAPAVSLGRAETPH
jgi:nucleoside-diphosphate-sugar epimerase